MTCEEIAVGILEPVGGPQNVYSNVGCMTRLRIGTRESDAIDVDRLKHIDDMQSII